jgi:hypothetical protein
MPKARKAKAGKPRYYTRQEALEMIRHAVDAAASATRHGRGMPGGQKAFIEGFIKAWTPSIGRFAPKSRGGTRYTVANMKEILRSAIDGYLSARRWGRTPPSPTAVLKDWTEARRAGWEDGFPLDPLSHRMRDRRDMRRSQAHSQVSMTHGP